MDPKARRLTNRYSASTAVVAFLTQPIPGGDEIAVVPMHYWFAARMAKVRGARRRDLPWRSIQKIIWYGAGARLVCRGTTVGDGEHAAAQAGRAKFSGGGPQSIYKELTDSSSLMRRIVSASRPATLN